MGIELYSTNPAANNAAPPNGWPEGMARSAVNDCARQNMADTRSWYEDAEWINFGHTCVYVSGTQFTIGGGVDRTDKYHVGRRMRAVGATTGTIYGTITVASYSAPTNTITVAWDSGSLANETLAISLHIISAAERSFASGTKLLFPGIATAPAGWSIDVTAAYDKAAIRIRTSASTATGGSVDFETAFASGNTGSHVLTMAEMPAHTHTGPSHTHDLSNHTHSLGGAIALTDAGYFVAAGGGSGVAGSSSVGGTVGPSVNATGTGGTGATGSAGSDGGHTHALSLAVKYLDACVCVKS